MKLSRASFIPNKVLSKTTMSALAGIQLIFAVLYWTFGTSAVVPKPIDILQSFGTIWENGFGQELATSLALCLQALFISTVVSLSLSYLTVVPFFRPIATAVTKSRFLSMLGFTFLFTLITSSGHQLKLLMLVVGMSTFFVTSMTAIVAAIPKADFDYARTLRLSEWEVVWEQVILGRRAEAIEIMQQIFAIGIMMLPMVEGISRSEGGVGKFLLDSNKHFMLSDIFAIQITLFVLGLGIDYVIGVCNRLWNPYAFMNRERA